MGDRNLSTKSYKLISEKSLTITEIPFMFKITVFPKFSILPLQRLTNSNAS